MRISGAREIKSRYDNDVKLSHVQLWEHATCFEPFVLTSIAAGCCPHHIF